MCHTQLIITRRLKHKIDKYVRYINVVLFTKTLIHKKIATQNVTWTWNLLCSILQFYFSASKTQVTDRIFKLIPIHATVICQIFGICWIQWKFCSIEENLLTKSSSGAWIKDSLQIPQLAHKASITCAVVWERSITNPPPIHPHIYTHTRYWANLSFGVNGIQKFQFWHHIKLPK